MKKKDLVIGLLLGLLGGLIGCFIVTKLLTTGNLATGLDYIKNNGYIGKVIALGAIPNFILFFLLLKKNKDVMAKGVVLAMFIITIITLIL